MSAASWRIHELAVLVYRRHPPVRPSRCRCGRAGCRARQRAAVVLVALGDDPGRYDAAPVSRPAPAPAVTR
ncbi:hypothetical protein [Actinocatenispora thailandica]|uniref:hypothetical protein n=1 Tax=Actinocatenispora thailandica TaxID=227318 RepID=UPI0019519EE4|nr:hypothetical protein [Actinocatenispora thailandica]